MFRSEIPFIPLFRHRKTNASPQTESNGFTDGTSASNPASIPAHGINDETETANFAALPARPNSAFSVPENPPCRFPRYKYSEQNAQNTSEEKITGSKNPSV